MATKPLEIGVAGRRVAVNVKDVREARRMKQRDLSARLVELGHPMSASAISKIEAGERRVDVDDLVSLAAALNITATQLLSPILIDLDVREVTDDPT